MVIGTSLLLRSTRSLRAGLVRAPRVHRALSTLPKLPFFEALLSHDPNSVAIRHVESGKRFTYGDLLQQTLLMKEKLLADAGRDNLNGARVSTLVNNGFQFTSTLLGIWAAGGIAVPYQTGFPAKEIRYITRDTKPEFSVFGVEDWRLKQEKVQEGNSGKCVKSLIGLQTPNPGIVASAEPIQLDESVKPENQALIIYTSGTTNLPKGVVSLHKTIYAQATGLLKAWNITKNDHLLHVLPLHHVHGVMAGTILPLLAGAQISYAYPFNGEKVWNRLCNLEYHEGLSLPPDTPPINLFMGVPTIYNRLLEVFHKFPERQPAYTAAASELRLAISGSSALPASVKKAWEDISGGQVILERYGMTEIGLVLSCGLPVESRIDNSVGKPVPGYSVRLGSLDRSAVIEAANTPGEIQVKGDGVFDHYWDRPAEVTEKEFTPDGYFCTGDIARRDADGNYYIEGRKNIDLIITGGENVSALEVEATILRLFPEVKEVAVVGLPHEKWGEIVAAIVHYDKEYLKKHPELKFNKGLRARLKESEELAAHKLPVKEAVAREMFERNAMGKINKKMLKEKYFWNVLREFEARERERLRMEEEGEDGKLMKKKKKKGKK